MYVCIQYYIHCIVYCDGLTSGEIKIFIEFCEPISTRHKIHFISYVYSAVRWLIEWREAAHMVKDG